MYPDDAFYDEDEVGWRATAGASGDGEVDFEPTEEDLRSIEYEDFEFETTWYEPYDWSDVISEHDYNDGDE